MPQIRFLFSPKIPNDKVKEWAGYLKGSIHQVTEDEAERWLKRGVVEIYKETFKPIDFEIKDEIKTQMQEVETKENSEVEIEEEKNNELEGKVKQAEVVSVSLPSLSSRSIPRHR